jgi:protein subunit release factor B
MSLLLGEINIETYEVSGVVSRVKATHIPTNTVVVANSRRQALKMLDDKLTMNKNVENIIVKSKLTRKKLIERYNTLLNAQKDT